MAGVADFARSWREKLDDANNSRHKLYLTSAGSINDTGVEGTFKARSLSQHHTQFRDSLEPGITRLVLALVETGCITYTSCEGHLLDGAIHEAHVGVLDAPGLGPRPAPKVLYICAAHGLTLYCHRLSDPQAVESYATVEFYIACPSGLSFPQYRSVVEATISDVCKALIDVRADLTAQLHPRGDDRRSRA